MLKVRLMYIFFAVVLTLSSCVENQRAFPTPTFLRLEPDTSAPTTLYCAALGLSVEVPQGWKIHSWNTQNLTTEPQLSGDTTQLERVEYDEGYSVELCELWSAVDSAAEEHASVAMYVEVFDGVEYADYIDALKSTLNGRRDGYISALSSSETANEGGRDWTVLVAAVSPPDSDTRYIEEYRVCEVDSYSYFVVCLTWWEGSEVSLAAATLGRTLYSLD